MFFFENCNELIYHCFTLFNDAQYPYRNAKNGQIMPLNKLKDVIMDAREGIGAHAFLVDSQGIIYAFYDDGQREALFFPVLEEIVLLRFYRKLCGMSRAECSRFLKVPAKTLEAWEQGKHKPPSYCISYLIFCLQCRSAGISANKPF